MGFYHTYESQWNLSHPNGIWLIPSTKTMRFLFYPWWETPTSQLIQLRLRWIFVPPEALRVLCIRILPVGGAGWTSIGKLGQILGRILWKKHTWRLIPPWKCEMQNFSHKFHFMTMLWGKKCWNETANSPINDTSLRQFLVYIYHIHTIV